MDAIGHAGWLPAQELRKARLQELFAALADGAGTGCQGSRLCRHTLIASGKAAWPLFSLHRHLSHRPAFPSPGHRPNVPTRGASCGIGVVGNCSGNCIPPLPAAVACSSPAVRRRTVHDRRRPAASRPLAATPAPSLPPPAAILRPGGRTTGPGGLGVRRHLAAGRAGGGRWRHGAVPRLRRGRPARGAPRGQFRGLHER